jgi:hypothetical protein
VLLGAVCMSWALAWLGIPARPACASEFPSLYAGLSDEPAAQEVALTSGDPTRSTSASSLGERYIYKVQGAGESPDFLETGEAEITSEGMVQAWGGVTLTVTSLVEGRTLTVTADHAAYDQTTGMAWLDGKVQLALSGTELAVLCDELSFDPGMQRLDLAGLRLELPLAQLLDPQRLANLEPRAKLPGHFLGLPPESLWLVAGQAHFEQRADRTALMLTSARFTHSSHPDPDLFISADEVIFDGAQVTLRGLALEISGLVLASWPQYTLPVKNQHQPYSFGMPTVNVSGDGVAWRQPVYFDLGRFKTDLLLDYSADYDLLTHGYTYINPRDGVELGVEYGGQALVDIRRVGYERHSDYNVIYRQRVSLPGWGIRNLQLTGEHGKQTLKTPGSVREGVPPGQVSDTRSAGQADLEFTLVPLGGGLYFTSGLGGKYITYADANTDYRVLSGRAGLIFRQGRFDNFVLYQANDDRGQPLFAPDAVRSQEVDFAASLRFFPAWRHVVQGVYDLDREELHTLQVSALKRFNSYEVGAYWDFVRDTAGLEIGLILD